MPPEKKIISTFKNVILQIYTVQGTTHNITKYYNTTGSHYTCVTIESKCENRVPKTKIQQKPDSFELVYTNLL